MPQVKGLGELADKELTEVADKAMEAYEDLMDLGMNVESRYSGRVFEVAGTMLKTSLDAKIAKFDKKIKMIDLQLEKEKLNVARENLKNDVEVAKINASPGSPNDGSSTEQVGSYSENIFNTTQYNHDLLYDINLNLTDN